MMQRTHRSLLRSRLRSARLLVGPGHWLIGISSLALVLLALLALALRWQPPLSPQPITSLAAAPLAATQPRTPTQGPLRIHPANPRYFADATGRPVLLTGAHTRFNFQDHGSGHLPAPFDYGAYLDQLQTHNHNFVRLWAWESAQWGATSAADAWFYPGPPYARTGPGAALDGKPRFDLNTWNESYFNRLRQRVAQARQRGIYVAVMLFNGASLVPHPNDANAINPWLSHPFHPANNINGIDGDPNDDDRGDETHTLVDPVITALQQQYAYKLIETLNDLDNVLWEISNESHPGSTAWQYVLINTIKNYEALLPRQHPVGMTVAWPNGLNSALLAGPADWISPNGDLADPLVADGSKVIVLDTAQLCDRCGDRQWVWKSFLRGHNPLWLDDTDAATRDDPQWVALRRALGDARRYAGRIDLAAMTPQAGLASTGYALANPAARNAEYLVYAPAGGPVTVDLSATTEQLSVEWFNPASGSVVSGGTVSGGGEQTLTPPFAGDALLYLAAPRQAPHHRLDLVVVGGGEIAAAPAAITYTRGATVELMATAHAGWHFQGWSGAHSGAENPLALQIEADGVLTATFVAEPPPEHEIQLFPNGFGAIDLSPWGPYGPDEVITAWANPSPGYRFVRWQGVVSGSQNPISFTISAPAQLTATFVAIDDPVSYLIETTVSGQGQVEVTPAGPYSPGATAQLTAIPAPGWHFGSWQGALTSWANPLVLAVHEDTAITALFLPNPPPPTVLLSVTALGEGVIGVEPAGPYTPGQVVTLTAQPAAQHRFTGWSGTVSGAANPAALTLFSDTVAIARFEPITQSPPVPVQVNVVGSGWVDVSPAAPYLVDQSITLAAQPQTGWRFVGWSGAVEGTDNPAHLLLHAGVVITATFAPQAVTLDLVTAGSGEVEIDPASPTYFVGQTITLTARAAHTTTFTGWEGVVSGDENPKIVTVTSSGVITATFVEKTGVYTLTLTVKSFGAGSVEVEPDGPYALNQTVTLKGLPAPRSCFQSWQGDQQSTANPATITMTGHMTITAHFALCPLLLPLITNPGG